MSPDDCGSSRRDEFTLTTDRLLLQPLTPRDVDDLWPYVSDPELPKYMSWEPHKDRFETEAFLASVVGAFERGEGYTWGVRFGGAFVGVIGLDSLVRQMRAWTMDRAEMGYWFAPPFWGRGMATESARAVLNLAFGALSLHKVTAGCISENLASRRVLAKLGFRFVGQQRDHCFRFGRWWSHLPWELTIEEWRGRGAGPK